MKTNLKIFFVLTSAAFLAVTSQAAPPPITWNTPTAISGNSDVDTTGTLLYAYHFGDSSVPASIANTTVNGILFKGEAMPTSNNTMSFDGNSWTETSLGWSLGVADSLSVNSAPYSSLSSSYKTLLNTGATSWFPNTMNLALSGLTPGHQYEIEWWTEYTDVGGASYYDSIQATAGNSVTLDANDTNSNGGLGQYVIGTFTAPGTTRTISFDNVTPAAISTQDGPIINAFQVRDITVVPEPSTWLLLTLGAPALVGMARMRRK